ncbi:MULTISPECIES: response regulator [Bacillus]|uniref:response regulator n=1 Tax=Bacillus TaxID=1386 RepID=UPI001BB436DB|nr:MULTISPECIES: response regulator [Bacillus]
MQRTILIVEDEDILREIMKDYLLNEGYNVLEAIDGKEALSIFEEHEVHLIILDNMLRELDGWAVCRRIRKKFNVPIIMLTARVDEDTLLGFELGADDRTINSHIRNLRHKLGQKAACIVTVVRAGYKFEGQV